MSSPVRPRLLLVDGHSMAYRAFFALPVENFATTTGQPTNAVYGFTSMLINLMRDEQPTHMAVAFDVSRKSFRTEEYPDYKATRDKTPDEFKSQVPLIREVLASLEIMTLEKEGFEADDLIATLAQEGVDAGYEVLVISGDRDTFQLVTSDVTVLYPRKGVSDLVRMTPTAVEDRYGVSPERYPDMAALVGEKSDNLPGVPGVGDKTAAKWLTTYGDLEAIVARVDEIGGKVGQNLRDNLAQVLLNRRLNALLTDVELPAHVSAMGVKDWDRSAVAEIFTALEFRTLYDRLAAAFPDAEEQEETVDHNLETVQPGELAAWLKKNAAGQGALDVEGQVSRGSGDAWRVGIAAADKQISVDLTELAADDEAALAQWLADTSIAKTVHDVKFALLALRGRGFDLRGVQMDTALAAYLRYPDTRGYALADLTLRHLQRALQPAESSGGQAMLSLDDDEDREASAVRAQAIAELGEVCEGFLADIGAERLLRDLELPLAAVLVDMEEAGIAADTDYLHDLASQFDAQVTDAASEAYAVIDREVNLSSPKQLQEVLFDQLALPKTRKIKTGYSTDAASLADLHQKTGHPFLTHLLTHRDVIKLRQTVEGLLRSVADDGRIHTTFQQTIAATGRLSSTDPNLQNIPVRTDAGRRIREAFVVGDGYETLLTADYSQIEMRIMAHLSGDEGLISAFHAGEDLHSFVGSQVFSVAPGEVSGAMRAKVKAMSFGLVYGLSAFGLSKQLDISASEARGLMDEYFARFGGVRDYLSGVVEEARRTGYTETIMGRRRYLPDLTSDNRQRREMAERMALNAPIQGSAADIIKKAMCLVVAALEAANMKSRLLLQVHDELIVEVAQGERTAVEELLRTHMGAAAQLSVPLEVHVGAGRSWHEAAH
ncbi:MAG TPA: DNA polymerase I [Actinomycetales bacterium]|nr:DNA polymerase I [Actinomycetales bacterium]